jgi:outer membrane protein TolC
VKPGWRKKAVMVVALTCGVGTAQAQESTPLRLDEAKVVTMALASHPTVQSARASAQAARSAALGAQLARLPELTLSARYSRLSSIPVKYRVFGEAVFPQFLDNLGARAEMSVPLTDIFLGLAATARAAGQTAEAAEMELGATRATIAYEARVAYLTYVARLYTAANAADLVQVAEKQAEEQRGKETLGTVARNDVLPFETALDAARMALLSARGEVAVAEATLRAYAPALGGKEIELPALESFLQASAPAPMALESSPRVRASEAERRAAEQTALAASLGRLPRLSAYGVVDVSAPSPRVFVLNQLVAIPTWEVGVRLEWSLSQATVGTARAAQARRETEAIGGRTAALRRTLAAEREGALALLQSASERARLAEGRVARSQALVEARRGELAAGTALPLDVVVAESDAFRAKNERAGAALDGALARARIDLVDGRAEMGASRATSFASPTSSTSSTSSTGRTP